MAWIPRWPRTHPGHPGIHGWPAIARPSRDVGPSADGLGPWLAPNSMYFPDGGLLALSNQLLGRWLPYNCTVLPDCKFPSIDVCQMEIWNHLFLYCVQSHRLPGKIYQPMMLVNWWPGIADSCIVVQSHRLTLLASLSARHIFMCI